MVASDALQGSIENLLRERSLLEKLLYRNSNQHACTKIFGYLKLMYKEMVKLQLESVGNLASSELRGSSSKKRKLRDADVISVQINLAKGKDIMLRCSNVAFAAIRSFMLLQQYLRDKLFLPLYTTLLALTASVLHSACTLMVHFDDHTQMMAASISERLTSSKYRISIELARLFANEKSEALFDETSTTISSHTIKDIDSLPPSSFSAAAVSQADVKEKKHDEEFKPGGEVMVSMEAFITNAERIAAEEKDLPAPKKMKVKDKSRKERKNKRHGNGVVNHKDEIDEIFASMIDQ